MTSQRRLGLLFVLVGPPGVGKNTLMNNVLGRVENLRQLPTATTRARRSNEQHGREHLFVNRDEFQQLVETQALIERQGQEVHGELYGMPKAAIEEAIATEHDLIADIDIFGAANLRAIYPDNAVLIFIQPESIEDLKSQMQARGETEAEIEKRMRRVEMEMQYAALCDYLITNEKGNYEEASEILHAIVLAERSHRALLNLRADRDLPRRKFTYISVVVPICGDEVLYHSTTPNFPTAQLTHGEFPHDAALRALREELNLDVESTKLVNVDHEDKWAESGFVFPLALENRTEEHHQQLVFIYLYHLDTRIVPPSEWEWAAYENAPLSASVQKTIHHLTNKIPTVNKVESSHEPA
jgi:guanylate kinase